jgi:hypothetical protein
MRVGFLGFLQSLRLIAERVPSNFLLLFAVLPFVVKSGANNE